jgi:C1A family cysteine protease
MKKKLLNLFLLSLLTLNFLFLTTSCDDNDKSLSDQEDTNISINSGYLPLPVDEYENIPSAEQISTTKSYPTSVNLSCPPILSQGGEGSCVSWGVGYAARSISWQTLYGNTYDYSVNIFSPEYIYNQIKVTDCSSGAYITDGLDLVIDQGVCVWDDMPYTDTSCDEYPDDYQVLQAVNFKAASYNTVTKTLDSFKDQLSAGNPIIVGGPVYREFYYLGYDEIQTQTSRNYGGHCYCVVGYDDNQNAFLIMNSWGTDWGTDGFGWISYDIMTKVWTEAYVLNEL